MHRRLRAAADTLGIGTDYDYDRSDGCWEWRWVDGPMPGRVAEELGEAADRVRLVRRLGPRAVAVGVLLRALGRDTGGRTDPWTAPPDPQQAPDGRTGAMADALVAAVPDYAADDSYWLARRLTELGGPAALLSPYTGTTADTGGPLAMTPIEHLTQRYAARTGWPAAEAWRERLVVLDTRTAVLAALDDARSDDARSDADPGAAADRATRLAAVALLGELRRETEELEQFAMDSAVNAGASYTDLGRALGVTRQVAHKRHRSRAMDRPTRLPPPR